MIIDGIIDSYNRNAMDSRASHLGMIVIGYSVCDLVAITPTHTHSTSQNNGSTKRRACFITHHLVFPDEVRRSSSDGVVSPQETEKDSK